METNDEHWLYTTLKGVRDAGPTAHIVAVCAVLFGIGQAAELIGAGSGWLALGPNYMDRPWTIVTNVYAHGSTAHLFGNITALALIGLVLERFTTPFRFHLFFFGTGLSAGLAQVISGLFVTGAHLTLGASGAILALYGYALTANPPTQSLLNWLSVGPLITGAAFVLVGIGATYYTAAPGVALVGHFTGFFIGLVGGRVTVLDPEMTPELLQPYL